MSNNSRLRNKLMLILMSITALGMALLLAVFLRTGISLLEERLNNRIQTQLMLFSENLGAALVFNDPVTALEMLSTMENDSAVLQATAFHNDGSTFAHYRQFVSKEAAQGQVMTYDSDIWFEGDKVGTLRFTATDTELKQQIHRVIRYAVATYAVIFLLIYLLALRAQKTILQPILALNQVSKAVAETKDYSLRATPRSNDEIGELTTQFNQMLQQISQRDQMLEKEVLQRTAELEKLANEFRHRAFHDPLTGVRNRAYLIDYFDQAVAHAERYNSHFAILLLDLDNFKTINDTLGHDAGDELLRIVAKRLGRSLRRDDLIIRLGGDEFVVLLENIKHPSHVRHAADLIISEIRQDCIIHDQRIQVTVSIGGSVFPEHGSDVNLLKRHADLAMYRAKELGRNQFCLYEKQLESQAVQRLIVQNDLRTALDRKQLKLFYQPKIDIQTRNVSGCEALVRWQHPSHGLLSPDSFIGTAEQCGLIKELDYYVLHQACHQMDQWRSNGQPALNVAINLSGIHFSNHEIVQQIKLALSENNVPAEQLEIEITEAMLIDDPEKAIDVLTEIRALGVQLSLDDFGTGYSSLSYLRTLPVDTVKLDRSFVSNILTNPRDERLIRGIVALARGLELDMVAEGVETFEQEKHLEAIGCRYMQGYYYCKPCPADELSQWLAKR